MIEKLKARAKINLTLDVLGRRPNGYHDVEMIMQQIDLYDEVSVKVAQMDKITLTCSESFLPTDDTNIAYKAAALMKTKYDLSEGFDIHIEKNIPIAAGLAGGSTDAAAVIKAINTLCDLNLDLETMMAIGFELGADVPFCVMGNCAVARGLGEALTPIKGLGQSFIVLVKPSFGVSTKEVYDNLDLSQIKDHPQTDVMIAALQSDDRFTICSELCNVLETATLRLYPAVGKVKQQLAEFGADGVLMSGSGPTVFSIFKDYSRAKQALKNIKKYYPQSFLVSTYNGE